MESSGVGRRAFQSRGHDVVSCDLQDADDDGCGHISGDVFETLDRLRDDGWIPDLAIFHPTCTYLTSSAEWAYGDGPYHQSVKPGTLVGADRREARNAAIDDVKRIWSLPIKRKAIENPRGVLSTRWRKPTQIIQPNWFGDDASKWTCLWLAELPPLVPGIQAKGRLVCPSCLSDYGYDADFKCTGCGAPAVKFVERFSNQTNSGQNRLPPGKSRWKDRSRSYECVYAAMADQWGDPAPDLFSQ